ncbi:MAG: LTA synthase family protein [Komagataeibacter hansenii]|nr:LTA synthase family protein [Novacetimonas hansenii]
MQLWFPFVTLGATVISGFLVESMARPCISGFPPLRRCLLNALLTGAQYGAWLALCGTPVLAAVLTTALTLCLVIGSNIKLSILGEPMLFCDVVAARSFLQHPKFYLFSIPLSGRIAVVGGMIALPVMLVVFFTPALLPHIAGGCLLIAGMLGLWAIPATRWVPTPDAQHDIGRLGLPGSLFLYWRCWRHEIAMQPEAAPPVTPSGKPAYDIVIVIQCESFARPGDLMAQQAHDPARIPVLPALARAETMASHWGTLHVSGFGAYTMRTEYGVLFGQEESMLGFRAYDPFLTAGRDTALSLPAIMGKAGYDCTFVHPHDLRFYARAQLMPACGFSHIVGEKAFPHTARPGMPYVEDMALAQEIGAVAAKAKGPAFIYAVTMENHGPWPATGPNGPQTAFDHYLRHLRNSDRMLGMLTDMLSQMGKKGLLVFFGDHRPSIPGMIIPTPQRGTPYVVIPVGTGTPAAPMKQDLTPAQLHHLILRNTLGGYAG